MKHRVAQALRMVAQSLYRSYSVLGAFFRPLRAKLGAPKAIIATAHKLARIVYHLLTTREPYVESQPFSFLEKVRCPHENNTAGLAAPMLGGQAVTYHASGR